MIRYSSSCFSAHGFEIHDFRRLFATAGTRQSTQVVWHPASHCLVPPNVANEPRATVTGSHQTVRRVGSICVLGRSLYSAELENCRLVLRVESDDVCVVAPQ